VIRRRLYLPTTRFRRRRMAAFVREFARVPGTRVLDVGGTPVNWRLVEHEADVTLLNVIPPEEGAELEPGLHFRVGDGTALDFEDGSFDVCFSNSTIEHLFTWERQQAFAAEMRRVGRGVWMQTPAREFFFEPHWLAPFIHWLPRRWQRKLARNFTVYGLAFRPSQVDVDRIVEEHRLLTRDEVRSLFPDCEIRVERFLGLAKSYIAVRAAPPVVTAGPDAAGS
jgi:hypothetical protein